MNLKEIKLRFSTFLNQFNKDDIKLVMQFLEMIVDEYNSNPYKLFEFLSVNQQKYDEINENSDCNSLNDYEIDRSNSVDSQTKGNTNQNDDEIIDEDEDINDPFLAIVSPSPTNNNLNKDLNNLSSPTCGKNSNGKRISCEPSSNLGINGNYILNRIGMIKNLSDQNKVRILDNDSDSPIPNGVETNNLEHLSPFLYNFNNENLIKAISSPETINTNNQFSNYNNNFNNKTKSNRSLSNALYKISQLNSLNMQSNNSDNNNEMKSSNDLQNTDTIDTINSHATKPSINDYQSTKTHYGHNSFKICEVCEAENGTGNHYGAFTCNSCRDFFKRAISIKFQLQCLFDENCSIIKENRLKCRRCRLIKCFKVGMKSTDPNDNKWPSIYGVNQQNKSITNKSKQNDEDNLNKDMLELNPSNTSNINSNTNTNSALATNVKGCSICEDVGSGYFYGVFACTNCAKFYSRHRISQSQYNLVCPFENNCELNQSVKKKCSKCRFEKYKRIIEQVTLENSYVDKRFRANRNINRNPVISQPQITNNNSSSNNQTNSNNNTTNTSGNNSSSASTTSTTSNSSNTPSTSQN